MWLDVASCNKFPIIKEILKGMQFDKIKFVDGLDLVQSWLCSNLIL